MTHLLARPLPLLVLPGKAWPCEAPDHDASNHFHSGQLRLARFRLFSV